MSPDHADIFAAAVLQRCAELLYAEMRPQVDATAAERQRRKSAGRPAPAAGPSGASVVSLNAYRIRKHAAA